MRFWPSVVVSLFLEVFSFLSPKSEFSVVLAEMKSGSLSKIYIKFTTLLLALLSKIKVMDLSDKTSSIPQIFAIAIGL